MRALRRLTFGLVLCTTAPSLAGGGALVGAPLIERVSAPPLLTFPLPQRVRLTLPSARGPTEVHVCERLDCRLYRTYRVGASVDEGAVLERYLPTGMAWEGAPHEASTRPVVTSGGGMSARGHVFGLFGAFPDGTLPSATLTRAGAEHPVGGVTPVDATALLRAEPHQALAFAGVAIAPDAHVDEALEAELARLVDRGGVLLLPMSFDRARLVAGEGERVVIDDSTRLVELQSQRVLADGPRAVVGRAYRHNGVIVTYDDASLPGSSLSDLLLAAVPKLVQHPSALHSDPLQSPAAGAAGIAASRATHPGLLLLPIALMLLLAVVALRGRRQRGVLVTPVLVVGSVLSTVALLSVPRVLEGDGVRTAARTYTTVGTSTVAFEEGAVASRPGFSGGYVTLTAPVGAVPVAKVEGIRTAGKQVLDVADEGRTLGLRVPGDGVAVAAWARMVSLEDGLRVQMPDGAWPQTLADLVVENRLPFVLDQVVVVLTNRAVQVGRPLEPGERLATWTPAGDDSSPPLSDADDARALAKRRLLAGMQARCLRWDNHLDTPACVIGVGEAADGTLVGVQVTAP